MKTPHTKLPALPQFVACRDVRRMLGGACNATINKMVTDGVLPKPVRPRPNMLLFELGATLQAIRRMSD